MSLPPKRILLVVLMALAVATVGVIRLAVSSGASATASGEATVDSLTAMVTTAEWTAMDHDMSSNAPGYQMPPAMMPGMPEDGDQRLAVSLSVVNTSDGTRPLVPDKEFALRAGKDGTLRPPHSDTFGDVPRLAPRNAIKGVLFFDLPPAELTGSPVWLEWTHEGTTTRLTIPLDGTPSSESHSHNP
jgi:hypothetical protein